MSTASSSKLAPSRVARRRAAVIDVALAHAVQLMGAEGVGALSVSEVARQMGIKGPSLYKYFDSRTAMYDALFARGLAAQQQALHAAVGGLPPGVERIRAGATSVVAWAVTNPALAQLMFWRPVPGFQPSREAMALSEADMAELRAEFAAAVRLGQLSPSADSDDAVRLYTVVVSGLISQQLANQPGVGHADGVFSRLTDQALDIFFAHYRPARP